MELESKAKADALLKAAADEPLLPKAAKSQGCHHK